MVRPTAVLLVVFLAVSALTVRAQQARSVTASAATLPVTKVVLYKTGVGYFEHLGRVNGNQQLSVPFTSDQLDDVLKSLTAVDLGAGRVVGVNYDSPTPIDRQLQALRLPLARGTSTIDFLKALRGTRVEVQAVSAAPLAGRLLQAERRARPIGNVQTERDAVTLVTDAGVVATIDLDDRTRVRVADAELRRDVDRYLSITAASSERSPRTMLISTAGTGSRPFLVSYVSESAVWKTTYRLIFPEEGEAREPLLQGWAVVDNMSAVDWNDVELSLVSGAPQTFVQPLSTPLFARRPQVAVVAADNVAPLIHAPALSASMEQRARQAAPVAAPQDGIVGRGSGSGPGIGGGVAGGVTGGIAGGLAAPPPPVAQRIGGSTPSQAIGAELGELFEYRLADRISIRRNQSALVPIIQAPVSAERVSVWNGGMGLRPRRAVWLKNTSGLTLDGGSISLIEAGAFAGEGLVESIKPGERRLVSYAADLGVQVSMRPGEAAGRVRRLRIADGVLTRETDERQQRVYTVRNDNRDPRRVVIEHPVTSEWKVSGDARPLESTAALRRFVLTAEPGRTETLTVEETRDDLTTIVIGDIDTTRLEVVVAGDAEQAVLLRALEPIVAKKAQITELEVRLKQMISEAERISADQTRLRENMKALGRSSAERRLLDRYTRELEKQEARLDVLKPGVEALGQSAQRAQRELATLVASVTLDRTF